MSNSVSTYRSITKSALAALLGIPESDLLTRKKAAKDIGVSVGYLANLANMEDGGSGPAYYRTTTRPTGGTAWYPREEVDAFADHRKNKIIGSYGRKRAQQSWVELERPAAQIELHTISRLIWLWKKSEIYFRAEAIMNAPDDAQAEAAFYQECASFLAAAQTDKASGPLYVALDDHPKFQAHEGLGDEDAIPAQFLKLAAWRGITLDIAHPSFKVMVGMFESAWSFVLVREAEMRALGYAQIPTTPPPTPRRIPL